MTLTKDDVALLKRATANIRAGAKVIDPLFDEVREEKDATLGAAATQLILEEMIAEGKKEDLKALLTLCTVFGTITDHLADIGIISKVKKPAGDY